MVVRKSVKKARKKLFHKNGGISKSLFLRRNPSSPAAVYDLRFLRDIMPHTLPRIVERVLELSRHNHSGSEIFQILSNEGFNVKRVGGGIKIASKHAGCILIKGMVFNKPQKSGLVF